LGESDRSASHGQRRFHHQAIDFEFLIAVLLNVLQRAPTHATEANLNLGGFPRLTEREREIVTWVSQEEIIS
jgi:hypothetical protein